MASAWSDMAPASHVEEDGDRPIVDEGDLPVGPEPAGGLGHFHGQASAMPLRGCGPVELQVPISFCRYDDVIMEIEPCPFLKRSILLMPVALEHRVKPSL